MSKPFNPLDKINLANSIDYAMGSMEAQPLGELESFEGAGIYALFYIGDFPAYTQIALVNRKRLIAPIYVGKAEASGKRKGGFLDVAASGKALFNRLSQHANSVRQASNLSIEDFYCRHLVVDETWIALGEAMLISKYAPVWNARVDGFGNHNPGSGRYKGAKPKWDTLHPGRPWAKLLRDNSATPDEIIREIEDYFELFPPERLLGTDSSVQYYFMNLGKDSDDE